MLELSNTTVNTAFSIMNGGVVIIGNAVISKDNKVETINGNSIVYNEESICDGFYAIRTNDILVWDLRRLHLEKFTPDVQNTLTSLESQIIAELKAATE